MTQAANLPEPLIWLQALSVPLLGILAAWLAYQQWRKAERKVQLDLFDRRFAIYDAARDALMPVLREAGADTREYLRFRSAVDKAFLLFGRDVVHEFDETADAINKLCVHTAMMKDGPPYEEKNIQGRSDCVIRIAKFHENIRILIEPYMQLDHKAPQPLRWLKFGFLKKSK